MFTGALPSGLGGIQGSLTDAAGGVLLLHAEGLGRIGAARRDDETLPFAEVVASPDQFLGDALSPLGARADFKSLIIVRVLAS